jgi:hypothetical protein
MDSMICYGDTFTFLDVDDAPTSRGTHLFTSTAYYLDSFTTLHVDDVRTSQEVQLWASMACYEDSFTFLKIRFRGVNVIQKSG